MTAEQWRDALCSALNPVAAAVSAADLNLRSNAPAQTAFPFATAKSPAALAPILAAYDQTVDKRPNPNDPQGPLFHTLRVFLIDRQARIRNIYSSGTLDPRLVLADVKTLLLEDAKLSK